MADFGLLAVGLVALWLGTELALNGTLDLAERFGVSQAFLGLSVLAIGTDLPELVVAISGGLHQLRGLDASGVIVGNAVGSAIANGSLVLGIAGLTGALRKVGALPTRDSLMLLASLILLGWVAIDGMVVRTEALLLLAAYALYFRRLIQSESTVEKPAGSERVRGLRPIVFVAAGIVVVVAGAELVVSSAVSLAESWEVSQSVIGLVVIGAGTSLPELALSLGAAAKGHSSLSIGNIVGSNVFDLLVPIGASALIHPVAVESETIRFDLLFFLLMTLGALFAFRRHGGLRRSDAVLLIGAYAAFALLRMAAG